jgi:hypothetical protein
MRLFKKILLGVLIFLVVVAGLFVTFVGPWPAYTASFEGTGYFQHDIAAIDKNVKLCKITDAPGRLKVGWGTALITPEKGVPLAGYSARRSKPSTGAHDDLLVKAVAFSDGEDTAVVVGSDMLLVTPNVAALVREQVAKETPLTANNILFDASHTHDGPGGFAPGLLARISFGKYDPKIPIFLAKAFSGAIIEAYRSLEPAKIAHGRVNAEQFIHNRARKGPVDPDLQYMVIEKDNGKRCYVVRFSAHPTILDDDNMQATAEYPGYLQRAVEKATGATCVYLGGAVGSMGPHAPEAPDPKAPEARYVRCQLMGEGLAKLVLDNAQNLQFAANADVVSIGIPIELPPFQFRVLSPKLRLSPLLGRLVGLSGKGWMQAVRVGDVMFIGTPGDFSGEISANWKQWAAAKGYDMWPSGFCADYVGYISPDKYYSDPKAINEYETGLMSWTGPHQEGFFTALMNHMVEVMGKPPKAQQAAQSTLTPAHGNPSS